jgi:hypothetical protein
MSLHSQKKYWQVGELLQPCIPCRGEKILLRLLLHGQKLSNQTHMGDPAKVLNKSLGDTIAARAVQLSVLTKNLKP